MNPNQLSSGSNTHLSKDLYEISWFGEISEPDNLRVPLFGKFIILILVKLSLFESSKFYEKVNLLKFIFSNYFPLILKSFTVEAVLALNIWPNFI